MIFSQTLRIIRSVLLAVSFWLASGFSTYPRGQEGHFVVDDIIQLRLNVDVPKLTAELLEPGHPLASDDYDAARDCKADPQSGDCAVAEIDRARKDLACEPSASARGEALKFLIHFVGDVHQPLHTIGEAKGSAFRLHMSAAMR